jgi:hypothetical protein
MGWVEVKARTRSTFLPGMRWVFTVGRVSGARVGS